MKKVFALLMCASLTFFAACGGGPSSDGDGTGEGCGCGDGSSKMDTSDSTIDMYKNGTMKAMYWVQLHAEPKTGQYWETEMKMEAAGMTMTTRWQIANADGGMAIVENQQKMDSQYSMYDYVIAYEVDLSVTTAGEVNVKKAWIGKPGEAGTEIQVMEKPEPVADGTTGEKPMEEPFTDLELAGGKWSGTLWTMKGEGWESKTWMASNGWFGGMIKSEAGGNVTQLTAFGEDAKPILKW
jgi:hypothetical protein